MGLTIYSYVDIENANNNKSQISKGELDKMYVSILTSGKCFHTTYSDWDNVHSILFECCNGNTNTFYKDSVGFIPPHILSQIIKSHKFKSKYSDIQSDLDEQLEIADIYYYDSNEEHWDKPDEFLIKKCENDLEILDFVINLEEEGIYYC